MRRLLEHKGFILIAIVYTFLLTIGSLVNTGGIIKTPNNTDKIVHFLAYFGLALLWMLWSVFQNVRHSRLQGYKRLFLVVTISIIYGILIEWLQGRFTSYRMADKWDIVANTIGVLAAFILVLINTKKEGLLKTRF